MNSWKIKHWDSLAKRWGFKNETEGLWRCLTDTDNEIGTWELKEWNKEIGAGTSQSYSQSKKQWTLSWNST
jgi:hypothetical protein